MRLAKSYYPVAGNVADADALMSELQRYEDKASSITHHQIKDGGTTATSFVDGSTNPRPVKYWHDQTALLRAVGPAAQVLGSSSTWQVVDDAAGDPLELTFTVHSDMWLTIWCSAGYTNAGGLFAHGQLRVTINGQPGDAIGGSNVGGLVATPTTALYVEETRLIQPGTYTIGVQARERGNFSGGSINYATLIVLGLAR